jgi:uncharacterized membrane protein
MLLALGGVVLAGYLTWAHFDTGLLICGVGDCHTVQASEFATVGPVPVAALGLGMFLTVLLANVMARQRPAMEVPATAVAFAAACGGTVYAAYLAWVEIAVLGAICQWCVASALLTIAIRVVEGIAVWALVQAPSAGVVETSGPDGASLSIGPPGRGTAGPSHQHVASGKIST